MVESFEDQEERVARQNATLRMWGKRNGLTEEQIERKIQNAHAARGSRNAALAVNAIMRKGGSRRRSRKNRRTRRR
jgi:hypothetical protein